MAMSVEIRGLEKLVKLADRYPAISEKHVNRAIQRSLIRVQDDAKRNAPFGTTGQLRQNWALNLGRFQGSLKSQANSNGFFYGSAVEFGTRPHFPPVGALSLWARRKGLNPFMVARSIARKGTRANPFFSKAIKAQQSAINNEFSDAIDAILKEI